MDKLWSSLYTVKPLNVPTVIHGKAFEKGAIKQFEKKTDKKVKKCGLFIHEDFCHLASSPDGLVVGEDATAEVKCPWTGREEAISPGENFRFLCIRDGQVSLKQSHRYFWQCQGQMAVAKNTKTHFIVYTFKDLFVEEIMFEQNLFKNSLLLCLTAFYAKYYRKFLVAKMF